MSEIDRNVADSLNNAALGDRLAKIAGNVRVFGMSLRRALLTEAAGRLSRMPDHPSLFGYDNDGCLVIAVVPRWRDKTGHYVVTACRASDSHYWTWEVTGTGDGWSFYWGHEFTDQGEALLDMIQRTGV